MGSKKRGKIERIKEEERIGREAVDIGEQIQGDGSEIKSALGSIDIDMDEDDVSAVKESESKYSNDFETAFKENVETKETETEQIGREVSDSSTDELEKVNDATDKFIEMSNITDIGRSNAEGAAEIMRNSANEYEEFISESTTILEETKDDVATIKSTIDSIWS